MSNTIFLIFHGRYPSEKAASLFAAKSAESFALAGKKVVLIVPDRKDSISQDAFDYYGVKRVFDTVRLPILNVFGLPGLQFLAFKISFITFALSCVWFLKKTGRIQDMYYSNESLPLFFVSFLFPRTCYEMHDFPETSWWFYKKLFSRVQYVLVHNHWKLRRLKEIMGADFTKAFYEPNAVDVHAFDLDVTKEDARVKCNLPQHKRIVVYTGHLYSWKGVDTLAQAAGLLPSDTLVVFVGGTSADIARFSERYKKISNVYMAGHQPHTDIPLWQKAADVVVLPNTAKENISAFYTSPMKLFEYMASGRPIVASCIPSVTEIVDDSSAYLCEADNPTKLAESLLRALDDHAVSQAKASVALSRVQEHTWQARTNRIFNHINI